MIKTVAIEQTCLGTMGCGGKIVKAGKEWKRRAHCADEGMAL